MKCPNQHCAKEIEAGSWFCPQCGTPVFQEVETPDDLREVPTKDIAIREENNTDHRPEDKIISQISSEVGRDGSFIAYSNGFVHDSKTGLEWVAGPDKDTNWDDAKIWVDSLTIAGDGWRMPTVDELQGLYQKGKGTRNMTPLLRTTGWAVWAGEIRGSSSSAQHFNFSLGERFWNSRDNSSNIRAFVVRSRR